MTHLAHDRSGPAGDLPLLLLHAGVADRRMWDGGVWEGLTGRRDVIRVDLRGFGESAGRPDGRLAPWRDVAALLDDLGVGRVHVVGASMGAGVAVEVALAEPGRVASLLLAAPGGSLIPAMTPQLRAFAHAENAALEAGDLDAAVAANVLTWVDGPDRDAVAGARRRPGPGRGHAAPGLRAHRRLGRRRGGGARARGARPARRGRRADPRADRRARPRRHRRRRGRGRRPGCRGSRRVDWPDVAHLPSMERPEEFATLVLGWLDEVEAGATGE